MNGCFDFLNNVYGIFGFEFHLKLSTRPEKYLGDISVWNNAEKVCFGSVIWFIWMMMLNLN